MILRDESAKAVGEIQQDGAGFEDAQRLGTPTIHQGRDLGVGIDLHEAAGKLIALADTDQPGVVLGVGMPERQQFFQQDRHLHPIGRAQGIQLEGVLADRQFLVMGRAGNGTVDAGEVAAGGGGGPDAWGSVGIGHGGTVLCRHGLVVRS